MLKTNMLKAKTLKAKTRKTETEKTEIEKTEIKKTEKLTLAQCHALLALSAACEEKSALTVSYPLDEEDALHYLLWIRGAAAGRWELAGALAVLPLEEDTVECIAMIRPSHRRKGYFTRLLSHALKDYRRYDFLFPVPEGCADVLAALKAVGAEYDHTDLLMEYLMTDRPPMSNFLPAIPEIFVWPEESDDPIGSCRVVPLSPDCICLCEVEISPSSRGLGHGTSMIRSLLQRLWECDIRRVILHVELENIPAVALYKKTGFRVTETLSYCLLPSGSRTNC